MTTATPPTGAPACPLCRAAVSAPAIRSWREYKLYDCPACGFGFCVPFKNPGAEYYARLEEMYPHESQTATDPMSEEYDACLDFFRGKNVAGQRLLDVGCGGGGFLKRARELGFAITGIDYNAERLEAVRAELGADVFTGSVEDFARARPDERFDVITIFEVVEHLDDPGRWLDVMRSMLKPGGYFFIGLPNRERTFDPFTGPTMEWIDNPPHHLSRWSAVVLRRFVESHSFRVLSCASLGVPRQLLALLLRKRLQFGLATKSLKVDQIAHVPKAGASVGPRARLILALVAVKEAGINAAAWLMYPFFRLACRLFGWQGVILLCVSQRRD
ncbi:MAG: class I SAM-dependent methyltransferase [Elusimicrobiota bacterium]